MTAGYASDPIDFENLRRDDDNEYCRYLVWCPDGSQDCDPFEQPLPADLQQAFIPADDVCQPALDNGWFEDGYTCPPWDYSPDYPAGLPSSSWTPGCLACRDVCIQKKVDEVVNDNCGDYNYGYENSEKGPPPRAIEFLEEASIDRCCTPAPALHSRVVVSADDSRGIQEALTTAASVLTRIGASLPLTNDEDPNSSPYDLDGWLDDFAVADWDTIFSQAGILFTSVGSVDWTTIGDPFTDPYGATTNLEYNNDATVAALFASIPEVHAAKTPASQTCIDVIPAIDGVLASLMNPKRYKDILLATSTLLTKVTRIDWDSPMQDSICTRSTPNCAQYADSDSCDYAVVHPDLNPCPDAFIDDGACDETSIVPGDPNDPEDQQQRVGLCAAGTDTNDCQNGGREQKLLDDWDENGHQRLTVLMIGKCTWVQQGPGDAGEGDPIADQGTCAWMPDKGCLAWQQVPSYAGSPLTNADLGPTGPLASLIPSFDALAAAFPGNTPDPTISVS